MTDLWDDVPDIPVVVVTPEARDYSIRTEIKYPDPDPEGTAAMWARLRAERNTSHEEVDEDAEDEFEIVVTQAAEEFDEPCGPLAAYVKLAHANGWNIHMLGHSLAFQKQKPFASGAKAGQERPDLNIECQWLYAEKPNVGRINVSYDIVNDKVRGTSTTRRFNGGRYSDGDLKAIIKGEK